MDLRGTRYYFVFLQDTEGIQSNMVTVASAQPHAGPGGRITSLSTRSWGLAAVYRMYPRVERVDFSPPIHLSLSLRIPPRILGGVSPRPFPPFEDVSRPILPSYPRANRRNDNWQLPPFFRGAKRKQITPQSSRPFLVSRRLLLLLRFLLSQPTDIHIPPLSD